MAGYFLFPLNTVLDMDISFSPCHNNNLYLLEFNNKNNHNLITNELIKESEI